MRWRPGMCVVLALCIASPVVGQWEPVEGPLWTTWGRKIDAKNVLPEYPRPQFKRESWLNLNGVWQFAPASGDDAPPIGKHLDQAILVPFPVESALSGVGRHHERVWYRRTFDVPTEWDGNRILLHFGAVDWEARVFVNGHAVGTHRGGYDPFSFDITDALQEDGPQELIVGAWDPTDNGTQPRGKQVRTPGGIWYTPVTGIWRTVWIEPVSSEGHVRDVTITPDLRGGTVDIRGDLLAQGGEASLTVEVLDESVVIAQASAHISVLTPPVGAVSPSVRLGIPEAKAWSPASPHLYDLRLTLTVDGEVVDAVASYFAMRSVSVRRATDGFMRLYLNGEPYFMVGTLDQGYWPDGLYTAPSDEALRYDIEMTKRMGFNTIRKHVKIEPARWYYWCDRLGVLVWQDMPNGDRHIGPNDPDLDRSATSARQFEHELIAMIDVLRNCPSIVMWIPFNEGWGQFDTGRVVELVKQHDPSRLVNNASGWADRNVGDVHDIHAYPGPASPEPDDDRAAVLGEFGGLGLPVEGHTWTDEAWGYRGMKTREELLRRYEDLFRTVYDLKENRGLAAVIYTQTTDVETEANGLMTYDRAVIKMPVDAVAKANRGAFPRRVPIVSCAIFEPVRWAYTTVSPSPGWTRVDFDDVTWKQGVSGFGREGTPGAIIGTPWESGDIWLRRTFELEAIPEGAVQLLMHHDEDVEVYINGSRVLQRAGYTTGYETFEPEIALRDVLREGTNTIAVHCHQTGGGQFIDVGLIQLVPGTSVDSPR